MYLDGNKLLISQNSHLQVSHEQAESMGLWACMHLALFHHREPPSQRSQELMENPVQSHDVEMMIPHHTRCFPCEHCDIKAEGTFRAPQSFVSQIRSRKDMEEISLKTFPGQHELILYRLDICSGSIKKALSLSLARDWRTCGGSLYFQPYKKRRTEGFWHASLVPPCQHVITRY